MPHFSTVPLGLKSMRQGEITVDPSLQIDHHQCGHKRGLGSADSGLKALNVWPAAVGLDHRLHYRRKPRPYSSECCAGMCFLIRLTSFPLPFLSSLESNKDRMMEGKDQACFQVQLHPFISYLSSLIPRQSSGFNPAPVFSAYKAELCL